MPVVKAVLAEEDLGPAGWRAFEKLRILRKRDRNQQALSLIQYAIDRALAGEDVELSRERLEALLADDKLVA